jgi:hypothetical protein
MSLLYKPLESITSDDLQALIDNQVGESLQIEYKTEVFDKRDEKKRLQFLGMVACRPLPMRLEEIFWLA